MILMVYDSVLEVSTEVLKKLVDKKNRLLKQLIETEYEIQVVEKQITGGASLDIWFDELRDKVNNGELDIEDTKVRVSRR